MLDGSTEDSADNSAEDSTDEIAIATDVAPTRPPHTVLRWVAVGVLAIAAGIATYVLAVRTVTGQTIENAALRGADQAGRAMTVQADSVLGTITITSMVIAMLALLVFAVIRRRSWVGLAALVIIVAGQVVTQILKSYVLSRPELIDAYPQYLQNSLPSGHTTAAMTILFGVLLVTPFRLRALVALVVMPWAIGVGAYTITAKWHRFSDTLAADAVALAIACLVCVIGVRLGYLRITPANSPGRPIGQRAVVVFWSVLFVVATAAGAGLWVVTWLAGSIDAAAEYRYFLGALVGSAAGSIATALIFWWTLQRVTIGDGPVARDDAGS
ncbi:phosphatase PAP2 family protein [Gordonia sp. Z-3]|uniref:Phosphatase PAP2 family protein n=1 Tax=Gordonia tangerina TaxID=2911060 RepID=A0ABS9DHF6_9ACTN|nr:MULTISPECIES: phosphatase PAP2 family protein [Gordonia]MAU83450.1 PA-phosphatase [Gordonia sp. (in: high G+C Gram-positive bacteria)]MCF3938667.1 phosphatase PAP2 family protein [Gordonia tangerina]MED5803747.1 phosphatase PAP2 family protein [Gordonia sp. Z-3]